MARVKLKWTDDLTNSTSEHLSWPEFRTFYAFEAGEQEKWVAGIQKNLEQQGVPLETQALPPEALQAAFEALRAQPRYRPLILGEHIKRERRPADVPGLNWNQRVLKLGELLIQKCWDGKVKKAEKQRAKAGAKKTAEEGENTADPQTTNGQDESNCRPPFTTGSRQAPNTPSLPQPVPKAYAPQVPGMAAQGSGMPAPVSIVPNAFASQNDRANRAILSQPAGYPLPQQGQMNTFCGYLQIWDPQTRLPVVTFSMNRFEDSGRVLGPFVLVHWRHVTFEKLKLFCMEAAQTKLDIAGFAWERVSGPVTFVRNTTELIEVLVQQTMAQLGRVAQLNLTLCLRSGPADPPPRLMIHGPRQPNTQAGAQQQAQQQSHLPALGQQQMPQGMHGGQPPPTPSVDTHHQDPRRHPAQRHHPYGRNQRAQDTASILSRPPAYAPRVAVMRTPAHQWNSAQNASAGAPALHWNSAQRQVEPVLTFTSAQRGNVIDLTGGDGMPSAPSHLHGPGQQAQGPQAPQQQASQQQAAQQQAQQIPGLHLLSQQATQHTQGLVPHFPQSNPAQTTAETGHNSVIHDLVRGNTQVAGTMQTQRASADVKTAQPQTSAIEVAEESATSRPELSYSDVEAVAENEDDEAEDAEDDEDADEDEDSEDSEDDFTAEKYFAAQRATVVEMSGTRAEADAESDVEMDE